ncbi:uncharacterized protein [Henckelia pumila]|uniref:uncharacterized protein isoform X2 n=1 Tax=Henckelia pumila TaxID=405737 RepID=UPI003C6E5190
MTNKRMKKLLRHIRGRARREEPNDGGHDDENELSQDATSLSQSETQNDEQETQQNAETVEEGTSQRKQNKRGRTVMKEVRSLGPNELLVVRFNERGQPFGEMQPTLANYVGTVARNGNLLPVEYLDWRRIPRNRLNDAWESVTEHFHISERHRNIVMQNMGVAWRRWRTEIKARSYDPNIPLNELLSICPIPHGLTLDDWEALCKHWKTTERSSKLNQENAYKNEGFMHRDAQTFLHWNINFLRRMAENLLVLKYYI